MPHKRYLVTGMCERCGKGFIKVAISRTKTFRFCSLECNRAVFVKRSTESCGEKNSRWSGGKFRLTCRTCGVEFERYRRGTGLLAKYCSAGCASKSQGAKNWLVNMRARINYERELSDFLEGFGYQCLRSAGSRGPFDLVAINRNSFRVIQVKSTYDFQRKGNWNVFYRAALEMLALPHPPNMTKELWVRVLHRGWRYVVLEDCEPTKEGVLALLKNEQKWIVP